MTATFPSVVLPDDQWDTVVSVLIAAGVPAAASIGRQIGTARREAARHAEERTAAAMADDTERATVLRFIIGFGSPVTAEAIAEETGLSVRAAGDAARVLYGRNLIDRPAHGVYAAMGTA